MDTKQNTHNTEKYWNFYQLVMQKGVYQETICLHENEIEKEKKKYLKKGYTFVELKKIL